MGARTQPEGSTQKRPRRFRYLALAVLGLLLALILVVVLFLPALLSGDAGRAFLARQIAEQLGVSSAEIGQIETRALSHLTLRDVRVGPPPGFQADVLRVRQIDFEYDLRPWTRSVYVKELQVTGAFLELEIRKGRTNVEAIIRHINENLGPSSEVGPLVPFDTYVQRSEVKPASFVLSGEGPRIELSGITVAVQGELTRRRLDADVDLTIASSGPNLMVSLPESLTGIPTTIVKSENDSTVHLEFRADASRDLRLDRIIAAQTMGDKFTVEKGGGRSEPVEVSFSDRVIWNASEDRLELEQFSLSLEQRKVFEANASVAAFTSVLGVWLGDDVITKMRSGLGLVVGEKQGAVIVKASGADAPLGPLSGVAALFVPGLEFEGRVHKLAFEVNTSVADVLIGRPQQFGLSADVDAVRIEMTRPQLNVQAAGGHLEAGLSADGGYQLDVRGQVARLRVAGFSAAGVGVETNAQTETLLPDLPGRTQLRATTRIRTVESPFASAGAVVIQNEVEGRAVLSSDRTGLPPISLLTKVTAPSAQLRVGAEQALVKSVRGETRVHAPLLIDTSSTGFTFEGLASVGRVSGAYETELQNAGVRFSGRLDDPRVPGFGVNLSYDAKLSRALRSDMNVQTARVTGRIEAPDFRTRAIASGGSAFAPRGASIVSKFTVEALNLNHPKFGKSTVPATGRVDAVLNIGTGLVNVREANVKIVEGVGAGAALRVKNAFAWPPTIDAQIDIPQLDVAKAVEYVPSKLLKSVPDLQASGTAKLHVDAKGKLPSDLNAIRANAFPMRINVRGELSNGSVKSEALEFEARGISGQLDTRAGPQQQKLDGEFAVAEVARGRGVLAMTAKAVQAKSSLEFEKGIWTITTSARAAQLQTAISESEAAAVEEAKVVMDLEYPLNGTLDLRRLQIDAPSAGVVARIRGRLLRASSGAFEPDIEVETDLDLTKLRGLLPENLSALEGKMHAGLRLTRVREQVVSVGGILEFDGLSYRIPELLSIKRATGSLPIRQEVELPQSQRELSQQVGLLGDDFEARLEELAARGQRAGLLLDERDISTSPPRSADYLALRPFYGEGHAKVTIAEVRYKAYPIQNVIVEGRWDSGLFRIDRFAARAFEGDLYGELALQLSPDRNVHFRLRSTVTDLNLDIPYAIAKNIPRAEDGEPYETSGTVEVDFSLKDRALNARADLDKITRQQVRRLFGVIDPDNEGPVFRALGLASFAGVRPKRAKLWISNNLASAVFDWEQLWIHLSTDHESVGYQVLDVILVPFRIALVPTLGGWVISTVNAGLRQASVSAIIDDVIDRMNVDRWLRLLEGRVRARRPAPIAGDAVRRERALAQ